VLKQKFRDSVSGKLKPAQWKLLDTVCADRAVLSATAVDDFVAMLVV